MASGFGSGESGSQRSRKGNSGRQRRRSESAAVPDERFGQGESEELQQEEDDNGASTEAQAQQALIAQLLGDLAIPLIPVKRSVG